MIYVIHLKDLYLPFVTWNYARDLVALDMHFDSPELVLQSVNRFITSWEDAYLDIIMGDFLPFRTSYCWMRPMPISNKMLDHPLLDIEALEDSRHRRIIRE